MWLTFSIIYLDRHYSNTILQGNNSIENGFSVHCKLHNIIMFIVESILFVLDLRTSSGSVAFTKHPIPHRLIATFTMKRRSILKRSSGKK